MKKVCCVIMLVWLLISCKQVPLKEVDVNEVSVQPAVFSLTDIDSTNLLNPCGLFYYKEHVIMVEAKNVPVFSFWNAENLQYEFSDGYIGGGPNEFIRPRGNYFAVSDSSFFILDSNMEWELQLQNGKIRVLNREPIIVPDAINQMVHLCEGKYLMAGKTNGEDGAEHILYDKSSGECTSFGEYPSSNLPNERKFFFDFKYTAGICGKPYVWDFFENHNLIRQYSTDGKLLREVRLKGINERSNSDFKSGKMQNKPYWQRVQVTKEHIYVLFYDGETTEEIWEGGVIPELQEWDWDGNLTKRILFDRPYDLITVSDTGMLYAIRTIPEFNYQIYSYALAD